MSLSTTMLHRGPTASIFSLPVTLITLMFMFLRLSLLSSVAGYPPDIAHTFVDPEAERLNHLVVDNNTGRVFVGGVNKLYQLTPDLKLIVKETTGPKYDSTKCPIIECPVKVVKKLTDNVNKALVIDNTTARLISCGSLFQGMCTVRSLHNISNVIQEVREAVAANDATASTVAFIAPGPPNSPVPQVMYVGVTPTDNSSYRSEIPLVSSRSLDTERMLMITSSKLYDKILDKDLLPINYVYGFSSEGVSYFLTSRRKTTGSGFISTLFGVCQDDEKYDSYIRIPIGCSNDLRNYNLVQAAYAGKPGSELARNLGITAQEDVLFAVFSESNATTDRPLSISALCVYPLKAIRMKFETKIQNWLKGIRKQFPSYSVSLSDQCLSMKSRTIAEDFTGLDKNTPLGGQDPSAALPVLSFDEHLTAVAATSTDDYTVVFVGTSDGHLKKIVVETATSALEYGELEVDPDSPVNSDLHFDSQLMHLYVMTKQKVFKVKVQECSVYKTCWDCFGAKDPYCGWCSLENKCNLRSDCQDAATDPLYWISYKSGRCPTIANVTPNQLQRTTARTLDLVIENLPTLSGQFFCAFSALDKTLITNATRKSNGVNCTTPRTDLLPSIPQAQHYFTAKLSVRMTSGPDLVATNFTFFDCNTYSSCTQCVSSSFPCDWCIDRYRCTHDTAENCRNDILVTGVNRIAPNYKNGLRFCPTIKATNSSYFLVPSGMNATICSKWVKRSKQSLVQQSLAQSWFDCQFNIEGRKITVNAPVSTHTICCNATEFSYESRAPNITVPIAVRRNGSVSRSMLHVVIYRCRYMSDNCGVCLVQAEKYGCGWCQSSNTCEVEKQCNQSLDVWLNRNQTCPSPEIRFFKPQSGPWEGGTNITIQGINLGRHFSDIQAGVSIAGLPCQPYPELYVRKEKIVCRVDGLRTPQTLKGPVIVKIEDLNVYSEQSFEFVDPVIESISPKYGPRSGGTEIRITGRHMNAGSKIQAFINNLECSIKSVEANEILCMTSACNKTFDGTLKMKFDSGTRKYDEIFKYVDDPTIESVESGIAEHSKIPKGTPAGGINVSVTGTNLGYIQTPKMYVYYDKTKFVSQCTTFSHIHMMCSSPTVNLSNAVALDAEHPLSLEYGFIMDNVAGVQNLSHGYNYFLLYPNPTYDEFDEGVKYYTNEYLTIYGQNLNLACQESDVIVQIGDSFCTITSLSRQQLTCRLPPLQPSVLDNQEVANKRELEVVVVVGGVLNKTIGKLNYSLAIIYDRSSDGGFRSSITVVVLIVVNVLLVVILVIWISIQKHRQQARMRTFIQATLERFNNGFLDGLNPDLDICDQAELLPYDKYWEFPRELLKLDKVLGSGAFGIVRKAAAKSICRSEAVSTVAVKLVRPTSSLHHMTALTRELKILVHLGKHVNIVNLLGACTRKVPYGELLVILEFCRFGNLRDYLLRRRADFVDQADTSTGNSTSRSSSTRNCARPNDSDVDTAGCSGDSKSTDCCQSTDMSEKVDDSVPKNDLLQSSSLISNYKGDYMDKNLEPICTRDLLCWAWQVSRGMKYLGSRRVLHGDLAARNILLADNNVVKICDFGLAKALYADDNYKKTGQDPLPIKWMSIEAIRDRFFSVQSDIWSFGIVLWEFFTLGETPYPGIGNENIYRKLANGFRMARPQYATEDMYDIMLRCWDVEPLARPSFESLVDSIADLLDENVKTDYFNFDALYVQMNTDALERRPRDYSTISSPEETSNSIV